MAEGNAFWLERDEAVIAEVLSRSFDVVIESGEGSWVTDVEGHRYLDFTTGIAVTSVGHCNPVVVEAIQRQAATLLHTSVTTHNKLNIQLGEKLLSFVPYIDDPRVFFSNSGAEAVEGGLKLARMATGRPGIISFRRAFHGRTLGATSITTARGKYRSGYEPLLSGVNIAPYCMDGDAAGALAQLDEILSLQAPDPNVGAMIVEPVLGEGGYIVPPVEWLQGLRQRCDEHGILLIFDEVQSGVGRTGSMFAAETFGVTPDVILFAKGIANGMPLSGLIASNRHMSKWHAGAHGTTFGGNPVSCAAALATLSEIESNDLCARAREAGAFAIAELNNNRTASVVDVRGVGLMIGVEFVDADTATRVQKQCFNDGVLILLCGAGDNVMRIIPPLNISDEDLSHGLGVLVRAIQSA